jgi:hypothetical protein
MKRRSGLSVALLALALAAPASAQTVPVDILSLYDLIPAPPSTPDEAYERAGCTVGAGCDADRAYEQASARFAEVAQQIDIALAAAAPRPGGDPLQGMTPQEMQAKLATMSREEQIAFAMAMSRQQAGAMPTLKPEPPAVQEAVALLRRLQEELGRESMAGGGPFEREVARLQADLERKQNEIGAWAASDQFKDANGLPGPEWHRVQLEAADQHLAAEAEYDQALQVLYREELSRLKDRYAPFQRALAAIGYGTDAVNAQTRFELIGMQQGMLRAAAPLARISRSATSSGAQRRLDLERLRMG